MLIVLIIIVTPFAWSWIPGYSIGDIILRLGYVLLGWAMAVGGFFILMIMGHSGESGASGRAVEEQKLQAMLLAFAKERSISLEDVRDTLWPAYGNRQDKDDQGFFIWNPLGFALVRLPQGYAESLTSAQTSSTPTPQMASPPSSSTAELADAIRSTRQDPFNYGRMTQHGKRVADLEWWLYARIAIALLLLGIALLAYNYVTR
jgi:hypothetical protein